MNQICECSLRAAQRSFARQRTRGTPQVARFRSFASTSIAPYPRQATPFRSSPASTEQSPSALQSIAQAQEPEPWYLSETPHVASSASPASAIPKEAPILPPALPEYLHPLWTYLFESPFFVQDSINFINADQKDADGTKAEVQTGASGWVDWIVVASLRSGRERGIRGASDGVALAMQDCMQRLTLQTNAAAKKRRKSKVIVEGLDVKEPRWCLVDGGRAVVHIMTQEARQTWQVEQVALANAGLRADEQIHMRAQEIM